MKAEEMIRVVTNPDWAGNHMMGKVVFTQEEFAMFCTQLCKEQRELCAQSYVMQNGHGSEESFKSIVGADEPILNILTDSE